MHQIVEAVLFASDAPLTAEEIARADESLDEDKVEEALELLRAEYDDAQRAFQVVELAEGYQVLTRPEFAPYLERFDNVPRPSRLSGPALETLAIIAYRQPIGRLEVEYVRGVSASGVIRTLQERRLIDVVGRAETLGRPLLYGTTQHFLEHFGFRSIEDLPRPEDLPVVLRDRIPLGLDDADGDSGDAEGDSVDQPAQLDLADAQQDDAAASQPADTGAADSDDRAVGYDAAPGVDGPGEDPGDAAPEKGVPTGDPDDDAPDVDVSEEEGTSDAERPSG